MGTSENMAREIIEQIMNDIRLDHKEPEPDDPIWSHRLTYWTER